MLQGIALTAGETMGVAADIKKLFSRRKGSGPSTHITNVNVVWGGGFHTLEGLSPGSEVFEYTLPFNNSTAVRNLPTNTFRFADTSVTITGMTVDPPFEFVDVFPKMPLSVKGNERLLFRIRIRVPQNYSGPMTIRFVQDDGDLIKVEINKVTLIAKGRKVDIESSSIIMKVRKGHIFKNSVQLYKALSYGDRVSSVSVNSPFALVSSEPKVPFTVTDPGSFIADFYIQAPQMGYAGPLEITLS